MNLRLIATDLDGTVLRSDLTVSERTRQALQAAEQHGVMVIVATGRPPRWMRPVADALGHTGLAVCANGAMVYDMHTERILEHTPITREVVLKVAAAVRAAVPDVAFAVETYDAGFAREDAYQSRPDISIGWDDVRVGALEDVVGDDVVKLLVRHAHLDPDGLLAAARQVAGDLAELTHSSRSGLVEISAAGVTKAATLTRIAGERGIQAEEAVAFGDMPNDLPMLAWAGRGYAMANAHPAVLDAAEHVAPANDDDGVAVVVEELLADSHRAG
ncbi:MAG: HAD family phosphatase [Jiangellaceae bacterium]|nr:HAD family phosphatase [Jiangellaceae bacterium]